MATRYKVQLDDIPLATYTVDGSVERSLVEYEYPYVDGSEFEDLGMRARRFTVSVVFKNESFADYWRFKDALDATNVVHNFVHPAEGLILGRVLSYSARHDVRKACAEVSFVFIEELQGGDVQISPLIQPQVEDMFIRGQRQAIDRFGEKIMSSLGPAASTLLSRSVSVTQSFASQFVDAARSVRSYVAAIDDLVNNIAGFMDTVAQPADSLIASIEYGVTVPEQVIGFIAGALDRYLSLATTVASSPIMVLQSFYNGALQLRNLASGFETEVDVMTAQAGALLSSQLYKLDNDNRDQAAAIESISPWNDTGEYVGTARSPEYLTADDLERSLVIVRGNLQAALVQDRGMTVLQEMAAALMRHVNDIKLERERTYIVDVPTETPLHLICHRHGIPIGRVNRILAINPQIQNPTFVSGPVVLYA